MDDTRIVRAFDETMHQITEEKTRLPPIWHETYDEFLNKLLTLHPRSNLFPQVTHRSEIRVPLSTEQSYIVLYGDLCALAQYAQKWRDTRILEIVTGLDRLCKVILHEIEHAGYRVRVR